MLTRQSWLRCTEGGSGLEDEVCYRVYNSGLTEEGVGCFRGREQHLRSDVDFRAVQVAGIFILIIKYIV